MSTLTNRVRNLTSDRRTLRRRVARLARRLTRHPAIRTDLGALARGVRTLNCPQRGDRVLRHALHSHPRMRRARTRLAARRRTVTRRRTTVITRLRRLTTLSRRVTSRRTGQLRYRRNCNVCLRRQRVTGRRHPLRRTLTATRATLTRIGRSLTALRTACRRRTTACSPTRTRTLRRHCKLLGASLSRLTKRLPTRHRHLISLSRRLTKLTARTRQQSTTGRHLRTRRGIGHFITFTHGTCGRTNPHVARRCIQTISMRTSHLFQRLLGQPGITLR